MTGGGQNWHLISCSYFFLAVIVSEWVKAKAEKGRNGAERWRWRDGSPDFCCASVDTWPRRGRRTEIRPRLLLGVKGQIETDETHLHIDKVNELTQVQ